MRFAVLIALLFQLSAYAEEASYRPGEGVQVAALPLYVGGYFSVNYRQQEQLQQFSLDDLALLAYGDSGQFFYLAEIEANDSYVKSWKPENSVSTNTRFHAERLYFGYDFTDENTLQIGKYNSPIGFWNLTPINVLRDTTSSPVSTEILFPKFTTGFGLSHHAYAASENSVNLMLQQTRDLDSIYNSNDVYNNFDTDRHYGIGLIHTAGAWSYQLNTGTFHTQSKETFLYLMASLRYESEDFKLLSEIGSQHEKGEFSVPYAGYVQGVYRFTPQHAGILRLEAYKNDTLAAKEALSVFGYTYRPIYPVALKAEYQFHSLHREDRFMISFSVLF